ncbi:hypothetical protein DFJ74DRAFT_278468 [Hyaloraphidium curvatum]|nr:hypothetical protein DFJ74DRAFT_278468 [Hyaloraphidium curvatum]
MTDDSSGNDAAPLETATAAKARYTRAFLLALQDSPLVAKPDNLPGPELYFGKPSDGAISGNYGSDAAADEELQSGDRGDREERSASRAARGIVLGPPKMSFASSRHGAVAKPDGEEDGTIRLFSKGSRVYTDDRTRAPGPQGGRNRTEKHDRSNSESVGRPERGDKVVGGPDASSGPAKRDRYEARDRGDESAKLDVGEKDRRDRGELSDRGERDRRPAAAGEKSAQGSRRAAADGPKAASAGQVAQNKALPQQQNERRADRYSDGLDGRGQVGRDPVDGRASGPRIDGGSSSLNWRAADGASARSEAPVSNRRRDFAPEWMDFEPEETAAQSSELASGDMDDIQRFKAFMKERERAGALKTDGIADREPEYVPQNSGSLRDSFASRQTSAAPMGDRIASANDRPPMPGTGAAATSSGVAIAMPVKEPSGRSKFSKFFGTDGNGREDRASSKEGPSPPVQSPPPSAPSSFGGGLSTPSPTTRDAGEARSAADATQSQRDTSPRSAILQMINHEQAGRPAAPIASFSLPPPGPLLAPGPGAPSLRAQPAMLSEHDLLQRFGVETKDLPKQPPPDDDFKRVMDMLARSGPVAPQSHIPRGTPSSAPSVALGGPPLPPQISNAPPGSFGPPPPFPPFFPMAGPMPAYGQHPRSHQLPPGPPGEDQLMRLMFGRPQPMGAQIAMNPPVPMNPAMLPLSNPAMIGAQQRPGPDVFRGHQGPFPQIPADGRQPQGLPNPRSIDDLIAMASNVNMQGPGGARPPQGIYGPFGGQDVAPTR